MSTEVALQRRIMLAVADGVRVFRNNVGKLQDRNGQWIAYGVCNPGGADLIGWRPVTITPDMVGKRVAVFLAIECKTPRGRLTTEQTHFLAAVRAAGGVSVVARSVDDALAGILGSADADVS